MKISRIIYLIIALVALNYINIYSADTFTLNGKVIDSDTKSPVPGATIKIIGTKKGTYTTPQGKFRLPIESGKNKIKVISLGYESATLDVKESDHDSLIITLNPKSLKLQGANVFGDIDANLVIKRAIEKKETNVKNLKTLSGVLYSKLAIELDGSVFGSSDGSSLSLSSGIGEKAPEKYKMFLLETFSNTFQDFEKKKKHSVIIQRRQTSNIKPQNNLMTIANFISFYEDKITLINAEMTTPLSNDAFSYYNFTLLEKSILDDRYVYVVGVEPNTTTYPAFRGTIKIVEGTYNLIEVDLKPSEATAISFVRDLHIIQKFEEGQKEIWCPTYLEITGKAEVDIVKGLIDVSTVIRATSIYSDIKVNEPLPDSIYEEDKRGVSVAPKADSAKKEFWEQNALREITPREETMYSKVDSLVKIDSVKTDPSTVNFSWFDPVINFNRVESVGIGWSPSISAYNLSLNTKGTFSFGQQKPFGEVSLKYPIRLTERGRNWFTPGVNVFSKIESISYDDSYPPLVNTIFSALFHYDYFDYLRKDGWNAGFNANAYGVSLGAWYESSRQFSLDKKTNRSIFTDRLWRENPKIVDGEFSNVLLTLNIPLIHSLEDLTGIKVNLSAKQMLGQRISSKDGNTNFNLLTGEFGISTKTFKTGYNRMELDLLFRGGLGSDKLPLQDQPRMATSLFLIGKMGNFYSAHIAEYGGNEYYEVHGKFNLTDLWWRAIGLPLYEGRGLDLILAGSAGRYIKPGVYYKGTGNDYYSEAGFGVSRIPTFISNVFFLGADFRWGIGTIAKGRFGGALTVTLPF